MIASVRGEVCAVNLDSAVVEVGGVGLLVLCTPATLAGLHVGQQATLATSLVVREDSLTLYGFGTADERSLFELLLTASGVGPKLAQAMLAVHGPAELRRAVAGEDIVALTRVPGIGRKGAQRVVLELKERIGPAPAPATGRVAVRRPDGWSDQVRSGLLSLGWSAKEADAAVEEIVPLAEEAAAADAPLSVADLLKSALRTLARA